MTANTTTQTTSKSPCGCSGSGVAASKSGCGCGGRCGGECETCQSVVYTQPRFFAGQLLTEEDLQSLGDYVVAKNRLHNRYLFGDGVVCGLKVTCPPCGNGHVTVNPGYALDCCGNDIVVSCPKDLDINQMVHELMMKVRKADCGDPCAGTTTTTTTGTTANVATKPKVKARRYDLYIDYCDQATDPVAPYASNATCGQTVCEPTRIQESFRFELRCPVEHKCGCGTSDCYGKCVGDPKIAERTVANAEFLRAYLCNLREAVTTIREKPVPAHDEYFWARMGDHTLEQKVLTENFRKHKVKDMDELKLRPMLTQLLELAGAVARFWVHPEPRFGESHRILMEAEAELRAACEAIRPEFIERGLTGHLPRLRAFALLEQSRELASESTRTRERLLGENAPAAAWRHPEFRLLAAGAVFNRVLYMGVMEALASMRDWLVQRLEGQQGGTHCTLLCNVNGVPVPTPKSSVEADVAAANGAVTAGAVLVPAVREVLQSCFCNALLPECPPCEDMGVLLACITVEDCQVTDICNLKRKFVLTWPHMRCWFPQIGYMEKEIEKCCCPSCREECEETTTQPDPALYRSSEGTIHEALGHCSEYARLAVSAIMEPWQPRRGPLEALAPMFSSGRHSDGAAAEMRRQLERALAEIKHLRIEQAKLTERLSKVEGKKEAKQ